MLSTHRNARGKGPNKPVDKTFHPGVAEQVCLLMQDTYPLKKISHGGGLKHQNPFDIVSPHNQPNQVEATPSVYWTKEY